MCLFFAEGPGIIWAYESLQSLCQTAQLKTPEKITSVTLRKFMATVTQVIHLGSKIGAFIIYIEISMPDTLSCPLYIFCYIRNDEESRIHSFL